MNTHIKMLSLLPLPLEAQRVISSSNEVDLRLALVSSNFIDQTLVNILIYDKDRNVHHVALSKIVDQSFINKNYDNLSNCCVKALLKNPNLSTKILSHFMQSSDNEIKLLSFLHNNTDITLKMKVPMDEVAKLVMRSNPLGETVVRSLECLYSNPWLLNKSGEFSHQLKRAALSYPYITEENMALVKSRSLSKYLKSHPLCRLGYDISKSEDNISYYVDFLSPAFDYHIISNSKLTLEIGKKMLVRENFHTEPNIIARLLQRFGIDVIPENKNHLLATTRTNSAMFLTPLANYYNDVVTYKSIYNYSILNDVIGKLGDKKENWSNFVNLHKEWSGDILDLVEVSLKI